MGGLKALAVNLRETCSTYVWLAPRGDESLLMALHIPWGVFLISVHDPE